MNVNFFEDLEARLERSELEPTRANPTDAGLDLRAKTEYTLCRGNRVLVGTGVQVKIPDGFVGFLVPRSSLSKKQIILANSVGIIDAGYRGELLAALVYTGTDDWVIVEKNERIVQLVIVPIALPQVLVRYVDEDTWVDTERGAGGFGSTGSK